jgi:hypothetical protein
MLTIPAELFSQYARDAHTDDDQCLSEAESSWDRKRRRLESTLAVGNWIFKAISTVDENWHAAMLEGKDEYDPNDEKVIRAYYSAWLQPAEDIMTEVETLTGRNLPVYGAEEFLRNCNEARNLLKPDAEFFKDDAFVNLRDEAIDAHREGRTADFNVIGE